MERPLGPLVCVKKLAQKLLVVAGAVTVTFEIAISSIAMFSPLVANVADILTLVKNFLLLVL